MDGNSMEELSMYQLSFPVVRNLRCFFSKSSLRISMPKPKLESHRVKIASQKLTQLRPKLSRVGKEVNKYCNLRRRRRLKSSRESRSRRILSKELRELFVAFSSSVAQRSIWQDTGVDKHQQNKHFRPVEAPLSRNTRYKKK